MQGFRTELENPLVQKDIIDLEKKIRLFRDGQLDGEKFRSLRLARGVYGQRQPGVQMIRIKLPYGKLSIQQLYRISDVSDEYATGNLHITTRQDIQLHYVSLERTPELWAELEKDSVTLREACGNTVRNVTASPEAGVDPDEAFDVTPYAQATFEYFLRNPICQDMGRKFKMSFSSSESDTAYAYMHDIGFIPKVKIENGVEVRGFKVYLGGGLGSQPHISEFVTDFMHEDLIIPFAESVIRVFDRHGERAKRNKARLKYLIQEMGKKAFLELAEKERLALKNKTFKISRDFDFTLPASVIQPAIELLNPVKYEQWRKTNIFPQKQEGYVSVGIRVQNGDIKTPIARKLAEIVRDTAADDIRLTNTQGILLRYVKEENLPYLFQKLDELYLAEPGFGSVLDITSCPGTDTCNLGISNSTGITRELEKVMTAEYPELIYNKDITIKISGCINACGQHALAAIGFHGSSMKIGKLVAPALQVLLGGGSTGDGAGVASEKIIKIPSKRGPQVLRAILDDYFDNSQEGELYNDYYIRQGKIYFYDLLNPLAKPEDITPDDFIDWEHTEPYVTAIGVGECASVMIDLVATLLYEAEERIQWADEALEAGEYADSIYHSYTGFVNSAKALLVSEGVKTNTQAGIIRDFDTTFVDTSKITLPSSFNELVYQMNQQEPGKDFATYYFQQSSLFNQQLKDYRTLQTA
ncbi:Ferredoxin--sulfite reductase [Arcticibacter svalbardensis MN12-7]|uniref:Ferredoxin--sulfite reductase n=1 Tax=Arcticibacter svalbardensis MN12-7 TaxID=1150600 RepID=R9GLQ7_9SPHI|nr:HEPN domain-containing protein [Arcticibacter svalbardensis]EOR92638.1 Ferredoxin--sulfite reductase [Arcticibacter svalbardensis MN12-7]